MTDAMKSSRHPPAPAGAPAARTGWRRVGRALALGLLVIGLPLQGLGVAAERIAARAHVHLDAVGAPHEHGHHDHGHDHAHDHAHGHDHPVEAAAHAHAHAADDHHHGAAAAGVLYLDAGPAAPEPAQAPHRGIADLETLTDPPAVAALSSRVPGAAPRAPGGRFRSHTGTPLERPPR